jgi:cell division septation protein DedD
MKNNEFREIQVSSSALVFIFLAILVLGVFIFLLGVSVGKKQAQMTGPTTLLAQRTTETVTQQPPVVNPPETTAPPENQVQEKKVEPPASNYYIQVAAFFEKSQAATMAANFKKQGYSVLVLDPLPTDKKMVYRVRLGGYSTREKAAQDLAKLNSSSKKKTGYYITKD